MVPNVVVDVGNTRIKWGAVARSGILAQNASLPDDPTTWNAQFGEWMEAAILPPGPLVWVIASVQPARTARLRAWIEGRGDRVVHLDRAAKLPLQVGLAEPDKAGIDRLLNAVAAKRKVPLGQAAVLVDAGSAVTIDYLDEQHVFRGGLIAPGLDLMAKALNGYTALLPVVEVTLPIPMLPATATIPAMQAGIFYCVSGCILQAVKRYASLTRRPPRIFFTGGQSPILIAGMGVGQAVQPDVALPVGQAARLSVQQTGEPPVTTVPDCELWPEQTLIGILYAVEAEP